MLSSASLHYHCIVSELASELTGVLILADLGVVPWHTAMTGTSAYSDALVLCPGVLQQLRAPDLSKGEYPACAAMTTGYVFRVENPATVLYLQSVGRPGQLTTVRVREYASDGAPTRFLGDCIALRATDVASTCAYLAAVAITLSCTAALLVDGDRKALSFVAVLIVSRLLTTLVIRRRAKPGWFGAPEPGVQSDLLVLLSQDRWVRIQGATDDVKAVTSGTWLRGATTGEGVVLGMAHLLVFLAITASYGAGVYGRIVMLHLLLGNAIALSLANVCNDGFAMHGRKLQVKGEREKYSRRLVLAEKLVKEFGRTDCFVGMGMIQLHQAAELEKALSKSDAAGKEGQESYPAALVM